MYRNPTVRRDAKIYRLQWGYLRNLLILLLFILIAAPCAVYGFSINAHGKNADILIAFVATLLLVIWCAWWTIQLFSYRLEVRGDCFTLYAPGKSIEVSWQDATRIDYVYEPVGKLRFALRLYFNNAIVKRGLHLPGLMPVFPMKISDEFVLLDMVYKYDRLGVGYEAPTVDELSIHL